MCNKQSRCVPAVVTKVFGTWTVNVRIVLKGPTWRQHMDQLRPHYGVNEGKDPGEDPQPASMDHSQDAEGTNTTDHTPTLPPIRQRVQTALLERNKEVRDVARFN